MSDFNRVILMGRIGNELELKKSAEGLSYLKLSVATETVRKDEKNKTHWHKVVVFGSQAEVCKTYLGKGSPVLVEGSLETSSFKGDDGKTVTVVSVVASRIKFIGSRVSAKVLAEESLNAQITV